MVVEPSSEPQQRPNDREGRKWQICKVFSQIVHRKSLEIKQKRQRDVIHGDEANRRPKRFRQRLPHAADGKQCKKVGESRGDPENNECLGRRRVSDQAQIGHKAEVDGDRGGERKAQVARVFLLRRKDAAEQRRQCASDICRPKEEECHPSRRRERNAYVPVTRHSQRGEAQSQRNAESGGHPNPGIVSVVSHCVCHRWLSR